MEGGYRLELREIPDIEHGTAVILQGETGTKGDRYFVEQLQITQPVTVVLMAADPARPLMLNLSKYRYDQSDRLADTGPEGAVSFNVRTQGELKIRVEPEGDDEAEAVPYYLIVWAGDDLQPADLPAPARVTTAALGGGGGGLPTWLIVAAALGAGMMISVIWRHIRGHRAAAGLVMLAGCSLLVPQPANAQARQLGSLGALRAAPDAMRAEAASAANRRSVEQSARKSIDAGLGHLNRGMNLYNRSRAFTEADAALGEALNPDDLEFDPNYNPPGAPEIPVHCDVEGGNACRQCYADAYQTLNFVRFYLEKLRGIYGSTKNYTDNAIAFGDAMAGLPGGFGLAWPPERKGIQDAFKQLGETYDEKYEAYLRELREGLDGVAACEKQYFDNDDWYSRFGFMYYEFMAARYKR